MSLALEKAQIENNHFCQQRAEATGPGSDSSTPHSKIDGRSWSGSVCGKKFDSWPLCILRYSISITTCPILCRICSVLKIQINVGSNLALNYVMCSWSVLALALCLLAFLWSSGRGGMGYGYLLLDAIDPVEEVGDLAGDSVLRKRESDIIKISPQVLVSFRSKLAKGTDG